MAVNPHMDSDLDIDIGRLFGALWRHKFKIIFCVLVITALVYALLINITPLYKSEVRLFVEQGESVFTRPQAVSSEDATTGLDSESINSQVQLLSSNDIVLRMIQDAKAGVSDHSQHIYAYFQSISKRSDFDMLTVNSKTSTETTGFDQIFIKLRKDLKIYRIENSRILTIEYSSPDPKLAAAIPEALAQSYISYQSETKQGKDKKAIKFLKAGIDRLEASLPLLETSVAQYRSENDMLIGTNNATLAQQQLSELSSELTRVRAAKTDAMSRVDSIKSGSIDDVNDVLSSPLMQSLREKKSQLKGQIADLSTTLLDGHPQIKALRSQLPALDSQIREEMQKIMRSLESEAKTAENREKEISISLNNLKVESSRVNEAEVKLRELEREVATQREQLQSYRVRYSEAFDRQTPDFKTADVRIIQKAEIPTKAFFPKITQSLIAALVGSTLLLSVITLLSELFSGRAFRATAVASPVIEPDVVARDFKEPVTEQKSISDIAAHFITQQESCAIVISPEGEAASASSILLTRAFADKGKRAVLLDLTGKNVSARPMLDGYVLPGINDLLNGSAVISDVIHRDCYSTAYLIPTGTAGAENSGADFIRIPVIINSLKSAFDMVVVETGTANATDIARLVLPGSDLLVSFIDFNSHSVHVCVKDLKTAGYHKVSLITP
jgi:uncharacterized protein involved in exopolysaccharide biosynthesis